MKIIDRKFLQELQVGQLINFDNQVKGFAIDSRKIKKGMGFVALKGQNTDGHNFLEQAYHNGASLLIVSQDWWKDNQIDDWPQLITEDPEEALQKIATKFRKTFNHPVLCITGSNGKTTTRNMITQILNKKYNVHSTIGNYNNQLGVPLSILNHEDDYNISVLELGTNHFGEIEFLAGIAQPTAALITNIGAGHVEFLKDKAGVALAKSELFQSLSAQDTAFINQDDEYIVKMPTPDNKVTFGFEHAYSDYKGQIVDIDAQARYSLKINDKFTINLQIPGEGFAKNALASFAVGSFYNVEPADIIAALENFTSVESRFKVLDGKYKVLDDTYNANPDSTRSALNTLSQMKAKGKKIFVFGDMLELGEKSEKYHKEIGEYAFRKGVELIFTFGDFSNFSSKAARKKGLQAQHYSTKKELSRDLKKMAEEGDIILVKGSRGNRMEDIVREVI